MSKNKEASEREGSGWVQCTDWKALPEGSWIVKVDKERKPYYIANVFLNKSGHKIITAGGCFYFDLGGLLGYSSFERYNQDA